MKRYFRFKNKLENTVKYHHELSSDDPYKALLAPRHLTVLDKRTKNKKVFKALNDGSTDGEPVFLNENMFILKT